MMVQSKRVEGDGPSALAALQSSLLESLLAGAPLPGSNAIARFPDRAFLDKGREYLLLADNLAGGVAPASAAKPVRVVSKTELLERARAESEVVALQFHKPEVSSNEVRLVVEGRVYRPDGTWAPLSSVQVRFVRQGNEWTAEEPGYLAG